MIICNFMPVCVHFLQLFIFLFHKRSAHNAVIAETAAKRVHAFVNRAVFFRRGIFKQRNLFAFVKAGSGYPQKAHRFFAPVGGKKLLSGFVKSIRIAKWQRQSAASGDDFEIVVFYFDRNAARLLFFFAKAIAHAVAKKKQLAEGFLH